MGLVISRCFSKRINISESIFETYSHRQENNSLFQLSNYPEIFTDLFKLLHISNENQPLESNFLGMPTIKIFEDSQVIAVRFLILDLILGLIYI